MSRLPEGHSEKVKGSIYQIISKKDKIGFNKLYKIVQSENLCSRSTLRKYLDELKERKRIDEYIEGQWHYFTTNVEWLKASKQSTDLMEFELKWIKEFIKEFENTFRGKNQILKISVVCFLYQILMNLSFQATIAYSNSHFPKYKKLYVDSQDTAFKFMNSYLNLEDPKNKETMANLIFDNISTWWHKSLKNFSIIAHSSMLLSAPQEKENLKKKFERLGLKHQFAEQIDVNK